MSQHDEHLAYGHYNPQQDTARSGGGGGSSSTRGLVGDTFKKLKETYKSHQTQQPGQSNPYGYTHGPSAGSQSSYQQFPYGQQQTQQTQQQNPPYHGTPSKDDKVSGLLGKLHGRVVDIGSDVAQRLGTAIDPHAYAEYGQGKPDENQPFPCFAPARQGNDVKWYVDGCSYFYGLSKALEAAHESIWILGAWVSPELYLRRPPTKNEQYRLDRMLQAAAQRGVRVNVIVQDEPSSYSTEQHLQGLHPNIAVLRYADNSPNAGAWAQNEKLCLIDGRTAFMGGFDLAFGNWDTNQHALSDVHPANPADTLYPDQDYRNGRAVGQDPSRGVIDRTSAPRMAWSDVGVSVHGQVADDLRRHFVERWNFIYGARYESRNDPRYSRLALYGRPVSATSSQYSQSKPPSSPQPGQQSQPGQQPTQQTGQQPGQQQSTSYQNPQQQAQQPGQSQYGHSQPQQQPQQPGQQSTAYQHPQYQPSHSPQPGQQPYQQQSPQPGQQQQPAYQHPQYQPSQSPQPGQQQPAYQHPQYQPSHSPQPGQQQPAYQHPQYQPSQSPQPGQQQQSQYQPSHSPQPQAQGQQQTSQYQAYPGPQASQSSSPAYSPAQSHGSQGTPQYTYTGQSFPPPPPGPPPNLSNKPNQNEPYFPPPPSQETQNQAQPQTQTRGIEGNEGDMDRGLPLPRRFKKDDLTQYGNALRGQLAGQIHQYQDKLTAYGRPQARGNMSCQILRSCGQWSHGSDKEHSIADAYAAVIRSSEHFIYIENESFITATTASDGQKPVQNQIGTALVERILRAARAGKKYKVIVVVPCLPEVAGDLSAPSAAHARAMMEAQYSSINRGGNSIMEMIAKEGFNPMDYIRFYNLRTYDRINMESAPMVAELDSTPAGYGPSSRSAFDPTAPYKGQKSGPSSGRWDSVSECHMLNGEDIRKVPWEGPNEAEIDSFITEEVHVHSKVMIADDRVVICGSASINDKSLQGDQNSEVAMLIEDYTPILSVMDGKTYTASRFAASLRRELFRKHLGLLPAQNPTTVTANSEPVGVPNSFDPEAPESRLVADPLADTFTSLWNSRAKTNTEVFRKVFHVVPDDSVRDWGTYKEFYGYCFHDAETQRGIVPARYRYGHVVGDDFARGDEGVKQVKELLGQVKGELVEMPLMFLIQA